MSLSLISRLARIFPQSLTAEILKIFGPKLTENFMLVFAGTTIKIPSTKEIHNMEISLAIYDTLTKAKSRIESRRLSQVLAEQHHLTRQEVRQMYKHTKRLMKEAKKVRESDILVGNHQRSRVKVKRRSKRRM